MERLSMSCGSQSSSGTWRLTAASRLGCLCLACLLSSARSLGLGMNPLEKTVELLTQLQGQVVKDGETQQEVYEKYAKWCKETADEKSGEVKTFTKQKAKLDADIQMAKSDIEACTTKIEELSKSLSSSEKKLEDLTAVRREELQVFEASEKQLMEAIDMLGRAIEILEKEMQRGGGDAGGAELLQTTIDTESLENVLLGLGAVIDAAGLPSESAQRLTTLLQARQDAEDSDGLAAAQAAPTPEAYRAHSGSIVEVMEDMRDKAEEQLRKSRAAESDAAQFFLKLKGSLKGQIQNLDQNMKDEKSDKSAAGEHQASAEGDMLVADKELTMSAEALKNTQDSCLRLGADHELSASGRKEELSVLAKAKKQIQASMLQATKAAVSSFIQTALATSSSTSFGRRTRIALISKQAVTLVKQLAQQQRSTVLAELASRLTAVVRYGVSTGKDPFAKVKEIILDMIRKLEGEMSSEAREKEYCEGELRKATEQREELSDKAEGLKGKMDQAESQSASLKGEVKDLQQELAELAKQQAELDELRSLSREAFLSAKADLQKSLEGTRTVIRQLRDFYANDDEDSNEALLQSDAAFSAEMTQPALPEKYKKSSGAGAGIIGILEVSESDLAKNLAKEETEESGKQAEYEKLTHGNNLLKAQKEKDVAYKIAEYRALDKSITDESSDYDTLSEELDAVGEYLNKVKERCIAKPDTYLERKKRREAEIKGLQEALTILDSDSSSLLQRGRKGDVPIKQHF